MLFIGRKTIRLILFFPAVHACWPEFSISGVSHVKSQRPHRDQQHFLQHCWPWRTLCGVRARGVHTQSSTGALTPSSHCTVSLPTPLFTPISFPSSPHTPNHHAPLQQIRPPMLLGDTCTAEMSLKTHFFPKCLSGQLSPHLILVMTPPETITKFGY